MITITAATPLEDRDHEVWTEASHGRIVGSLGDTDRWLLVRWDDGSQTTEHTIDLMPVVMNEDHVTSWIL
jgi:hypothetical protein